MSIRDLSPRIEPALALSIGEAPDEGRNYPRKLDWIRAKPGKDGQWQRAARQFDEVYHVERDAAGRPVTGPRAVPIYLQANEVPDCVDIRYLAFGMDRLAARGTTNYAAHPEQAGERERILAYPPDHPEPVERWITGPADPYCFGGEDGIPQDRSGKEVLAIHTTFTFGLVDVGTFTAPCSLTTKSQSSTGNLMQALWRIRATGTLTGWVLLLVVKPMRRTYWDQKEGKRKRTVVQTWDLVGPVAEHDGKWLPMGVPEIRAEIEQTYQRRMLAGLPEHGVQKTGALPPARPAELEDGGGWIEPPAAETVDGTAEEVPEVDDPDAKIPFGE